MTFSPIAVVGQGCVLPGALTPEALWALVRDGRTALSEMSDAELRPGPRADRKRLAREVASRVGGLVQGFDAVFEADGFCVPGHRVRGLDPVCAWPLHAAREALKSAGFDPTETHPSGIVVLGNLSYPTPGLVDFALETWSQGAPASARGRHVRPPSRVDARNRFMSGLPAQLTATAIGFGGGGFSVDAACASSLYAIKLACDRLHDGTADIALAGGVNHADILFLQLGFTALSALSPSGQSRPFHPDADGLVAAQGAAMVVLKRLADAVSSGDRILGVVRGVGLSNDGRSRGLLVPSEAGQVRAMRAAYAMSGIAPRDVSLVECHATGTRVGDAVELASLRSVFEGAADVPIGSLKSNLGHLITASGAAALIKVLAAMEARVRPASLNAGEQKVRGAGPLRVLTTLEGWPADGPRLAAISNFGFGGNNAHLLVSEWREDVADGVSVSVPAPVVSAGLEATATEIAVIALSVTAGAAGSTTRFEEVLRDGRSLVSGEPRQAVAGDFEIDVGGLRVPPADLKEALPQQTLLLQCVLDLEDVVAELPRERTALLVGMQCDAEVARCCLRWRSEGDADAGSATADPLGAATVLTAACRTSSPIG